MGDVISIAPGRDNIVVLSDVKAFADRIRSLTMDVYESEGTMPPAIRKEPRAVALAILLAAGWLMGEDPPANSEEDEDLIEQCICFLREGIKMKQGSE